MSEAPTRLEKLMAMMILMQMRDATQREKVVVMSRAGFSNPDIADLLETKPNIVAQHLYASKKSTRRKKTERKREPRSPVEKE